MTLISHLDWEAEDAPRTLQQNLDASLGVAERGTTIYVGDLVASLDTRGRLRMLELRQRPSPLTRPLDTSSRGDAQPGQVQFSVPTDENGIGSVEAEWHLALDPARHVAVLSTMDNAAIDRWYRVASTLSVGVTTHDAVVAWQFTNISVAP